MLLTEIKRFFCGCKYRPLILAANLFLQLFITIFKKGIESLINVLTTRDMQRKLFFDLILDYNALSCLNETKYLQSTYLPVLPKG